MNASPRGRRVAQGRRPTVGRGALLGVVLVLVSAVAVLLTRQATVAPAAAPAEGTVVDRTLLACPGTDERGLRSTVDVGLAPVTGPSGKLGEQGTLKVAASAQKLARGQMSEVRADPAPELDARGQVAAGLFGFRTDTVDTASGVAACAAPRAEWWFAGAGAGLDHASQLALANVDPGPAVVDIRVHGQDGLIDTVGTRGITIAPGTTRFIPLSDVAPQNDEVAVHVKASRGRVAATMSDRFARRAAGAMGFEWLPASPQPARRVLLTGLPAKADARTLLVANPSDSEALVELEVSGSRGRYVPTGFETLSVAPGAVRVIDVSDMLTGKEATAVRLTSQVPIVGSLRSVRGSDSSYAGAAQTLTGPAAVPVPSGTVTTVQLTAGADGATAQMAGFDAKGGQTGKDMVSVDPSATATWAPPKRTAYVVVTPAKGKVAGAATYAGGQGVAALPLQSLPLRVDVPSVVPGPR